MVYGFAKQSGGTVTIESDARTRHDGAAVSAARREPKPHRPPVATRRRRRRRSPRTILVVEDETAVRNTVRRQLESLGHRVLVAEAAAEALRLLEGPRALDVLLTDVVLGDGHERHRARRAAREAAARTCRSIFMSGYTAVPDAQQRIRESGAPLLAKPSTISAARPLCHRLRLPRERWATAAR